MSLRRHVHLHGRGVGQTTGSPITQNDAALLASSGLLGTSILIPLYAGDGGIFILVDLFFGVYVGGGDREMKKGISVIVDNKEKKRKRCHVLLSILHAHAFRLAHPLLSIIKPR